MPSCNVCLTVKPLDQFYTRYDGQKPQPTCIPCKKIYNSLRVSVNGRQIAPSIEEVRKKLGVVTNTTPVLKQAGHKYKARKIERDAEVEAALGVLRDARAQANGVQGYVYCISDGEYLKVGYSVNPPKRVAELQTGNARKLELVGSKPGTESDERALHAKYKNLNVLQEWFQKSPAIVKEFD